MSLTNWETTRDNLHSVAQILGRIRKTYIERQPNALHWSLNVTPEGLSTGKISIGELRLNFGEGLVTFHMPNKEVKRYELVNPDDMAELEDLAPDAPPTLDGNMNMPVYIEKAYPVDTTLAAEYAGTLYMVFTLVSRFRAQLSGTMTPVVVWPHHFDLSFLWFINGEADDHNTPHLNFGFAPFSEGFPRPYFYAYAWPMPEGITGKSLPTPAYWHTGSWKGVVIDYDTLAREQTSEAQIELMLGEIFTLLSPRLLERNQTS
jgi:hypothetical protein